MSLRDQIGDLRERFDALTLRERALVALGVLAVLISAWRVFAFAPLDARSTQLRRQLDSTHARIAALDAQAESLVQRQGADPDAGPRARLRALQTQLTEVDGALRERMRGLIDPVQMAAVLEQVLTRKTDLRLVQVHSKPAQPLLSAAKGAEPGAWRHTVVLELRGSYLDTVRYLRALQALPWDFYWDGVSLQVERYPQATITITVHTLSLQKGWIGV